MKNLNRMEEFKFARAKSFYDTALFPLSSLTVLWFNSGRSGCKGSLPVVTDKQWIHQKHDIKILIFEQNIDNKFEKNADQGVLCKSILMNKNASSRKVKKDLKISRKVFKFLEKFANKKLILLGISLVFVLVFVSIFVFFITVCRKTPSSFSATLHGMIRGCLIRL